MSFSELGAPSFCTQNDSSIDRVMRRGVRSGIVIQVEFSAWRHEMRRPLNYELTPEDRKLARRWVIAITSIYSTISILLLGIILATTSWSTPEHERIAGQNERESLSRNGLDARPYPEFTDLDRA